MRGTGIPEDHVVHGKCARCTGRRRGLAAALWPQLLALKHKDKQLRLGAAEPQAESSLAVQAAAAGIERWDVFISHAGEQKRSFACWLEQDLGRAGVKAFLDEHCLHLGDDADSVMEGAVRGWI
ncbi:hypothetical protein WJX72_003575 [[Myrmecia] bisecta]|uniref:TIR domain-containing protein n=1 Tax=[Myrmecia] bisecta TaxID=41462 RepID=A0AAW1P0R4_9CHLO